MSTTFYKIEKGIPIPPPGGAETVKGTMAQLRIGDSFLVPLSKRNSLFIRAGELGIKITTRIEKGGVRVWRTKK